ncbi:MAG: ABC transporter ATP-binding protein [Pseudomonadota bacterium]
MTPLLKLTGITKTYPAVVANDGIDLAVLPGQIHAVLGENGAGKSTLMKIIYGVTEPDAGEVEWQGESVSIRSPAHARALGIGMVFQHFSLFETLTVAENIALAVPGRIVDLSRRIQDAAERYGLDVRPDARVQALSVGERQRVEILRCILQDPKLIIMDEPTSVLPPHSVAQLFDTLRALAGEGYGILFISHKLDEIQALCDSATVLRHGKVNGRTDPRTETPQSLARMMIGRDLPHANHATDISTGEERLGVFGLYHTPDDPFAAPLTGVSLTVRSGEIVGIAGVSGNGQDALARMLSGETVLPALQADCIQLDAEPVGHLGPANRRRRGLHFIPEERLGRGAVPAHALSENALLTGYDAGLAHGGFLDFGAMRRFAARTIEQFDVRCGGPGSAAQSLSGGNLQKFIVGREIELEPRVLFVSQPTWGVDVGAAAAIRQKLVDLRDQGVAVLVISEDLEELFEIADRLHVLFRGRLSLPVRATQTDVERVGLAMAGDFGQLERSHEPTTTPTEPDPSNEARLHG